MTKRVSKQLNSFKYKGEATKISIGTLALTALCVLLIIVATFSQVSIKHPYIPLDIFNFLSQPDLSEAEILHHLVKRYKYIPQIPVVFFVLSLMGRKFGILSIILYIILGFFYPIFALGGGLGYIFEYGFGYILAFIPAMFFAGTLLKGKPSFWRVLLISALGVAVIHILGILYMLFIAILRHDSMDIVWGWIVSQSGIKIFYDIVFSMIAIYLGRLTKRLLWLIMC